MGSEMAPLVELSDFEGLYCIQDRVRPLLYY